MTKLLDLDSIAPPQKSVKFGGTEYPIVEMTVGLFVAVKQLEAKDIEKMAPADQVIMYTDLVRKLIPSVPEDVVSRLTVPQLQKIFTFAMEAIEEENEAAAGDEAK
jgi:hypothetical protein